MLVNVDKLITVNRIDVIFKSLYLKFSHLGAQKIANRLYNDHIKLITNGLYNEKGSNKESLEDYIDEFKIIADSIKSKGFDKEISRIPTSINGCITNGSHRLATALFLNIKSVEVEETNSAKHIYDYKFFIERGISLDLVDLVIYSSLYCTNNNYLAIIWPSANKKVDYINDFPNILYEKKIALNPRGAQSFTAKVYKEHKWVGSFDEGYTGAINKVNETFKDYTPIHFVFFKENSLEKVIRIKERLRDKFGIKKASIHITDTNEETQDIGRIILNKNSIHFMNFGVPNKFPETFNKLKIFKEILDKNEIDLSSIVLTGDVILSLYGLKSTDNIEFLSTNQLEFELSYLINGNSELIFYEESLEELLYDPTYYFYFYDFKFISFDTIRKFKLKRDNLSDKQDINLITSKNYKINSGFKSSVSNYLTNLKFRFIGWIIPISKKLYIYSFLKSLYKSMKVLF